MVMEYELWASDMLTGYGYSTMLPSDFYRAEPRNFWFTLLTLTASIQDRMVAMGSAVHNLKWEVVHNEEWDY